MGGWSFIEKNLSWIILVAAIWVFGDMGTDIYNLVYTYKEECDRIDGHCGYFYASIVAMIGPFIVTAVFILLLKLLRDDDDHDDGCYEYSLMLAAGVFPFYNLWVAILEKCGKKDDQKFGNWMKMAQILGESVPQAVIAVVWLGSQGDVCTTGLLKCWMVPSVSLVFSTVNILIGILMGAISCKFDTS